MDKKGILRVFVSSTYRDLKDVRELLFQEIGKALEAVAMEKFVPVDNSSHDETLQYLEKSDISIFIIGDYYGTIIEECMIRTNMCKDCKGGISYTHCEYRRAKNAEKPHMVYIVENEISDTLSGIEKFDLEGTDQNDILEFLRRNNINCSKSRQFSGYTLQEIRELWRIFKDKNRKKLDAFKEEVSKSGLRYSKVISKKEDYYTLCETIRKHLKRNIMRWYKEEKIKFSDFVGRREELLGLIEKIHRKNSVCVVGTGGIGKTSLIQLVLLLEKLSGRKIYVHSKKYTYSYTREGYSFAKEKFYEKTFNEDLKLNDILKLIFDKDSRLDDILRMDEDSQVSILIEELNREKSVLFIDDFQYAEKDVRKFVFECGNKLSDSAVVAGVRQKGGCYSTIGPLSGLEGDDLNEMILLLAETYDVKQYVEDNIDRWSREIFRITQGHPMLVDFIIRNAYTFPDCRGLEGIMSVINVEDRKAVYEILDRLIYRILVKEELDIIRTLSTFRYSVDEKAFGLNGRKKALHDIIGKGFLNRDREGRLVFTFNVIRELPIVEEYLSIIGKPLSVEVHMSKEEREFISAMKEKNEQITKDSINEAIYWIYRCLEVGNIGQAVRFSLAAVAMSRYLGDFPHLIESAMYGGEILYYQNDYEESLEQYLKVLKTLESSIPVFGLCKHKEAEACCYFNVGIIYSTRGMIDNALDAFQKSICITEQIMMRDIARSAHLEVGNLYLDKRCIEKAIFHFEKAIFLCDANEQIYIGRILDSLINALKICRFYGSKNDRKRIYINIGNISAKLEEWDRVLIYYKKSLKITKETHDRQCEAFILTGLGHVTHVLNHKETAVHYYEKALEIHENLNNKEGEAVVHMNLGNLSAEKKDSTTALVHYATAERLYQDLGYLSHLQLLYKNMGKSFEDTNDLTKALTLYTKSIDLLEKVKNFTRKGEMEVGFIEKREDVFEYAIAASIKINNTEKVLQYIERAKKHALTALLEKKRVTYSSITNILNLGFVSIKDIKEMIGDSLLIEYFVFDDSLCAVIVGKDTKTVETIEFTPEFKDIMDRRKFMRKMIGERGLFLLQNTSEFYENLFSPLEHYIEEDQHVCIVPHGVLHYVPFHALFDGKRYLVERFGISYSPSAAILKFCMEKEIRNHQHLVTGGGSRSAEKEALEVAEILSTIVLEPPKATFEKNCSDKNIIHLTCHGVSSQKDPLYSYIAFKDGNLYTRNIFNLDLQADLVTLSNCETEVSEIAGGDELLGLAQAFMFAGAKSLVHPLLPVYGISTQRLMVQFYRNLKNSQSKLESLRNAQLALLHSDRFNNPFYWAPFVLMGDWR